MLRASMLNKSMLLGLALLAAAPALAPAFAQGRGGSDRHDNRGRSDNNNRGPQNRGPDNRDGNRDGNRGGNRGPENRGPQNRGPENRGPQNSGPVNRGPDRNDYRAPVVRYDNNRGGGWDRRDNRDRNWNNNWNWNDTYRRYDRSHTSLSLGFIFGSPGYSYGYPYGYGYREPVYYNDWGLYPGECRWVREFAYWRGRPADVEVRRCADDWGNVYVVQSSARLWRYR